MKIKSIISDKDPFIIAGPCSAESKEQILETAKAIKNNYPIDVFRAGIWKPRTRPSHFEGIGDKGLSWLEEVKKTYQIPVITEVATPRHVELCLKYNIDMLWIGARTTVNPFYIQEIANALQGLDLPILVKNPLHADIGLWIGAVERIYNAGIKKVIAVHRGFFDSQSTPYRNDPKWEVVIELMEKLPEIDIICDPSHIAGKANLIEEISQTAFDLNVKGLMIETHLKPNAAKTDANQQITPKQLNKILSSIIHRRSNSSNESFNLILNELRKKIDAIDIDLINNLLKRFDFVDKIGSFKRKNNVTIFQLARWLEILKTRKEISQKLGVNQYLIKELFQIIHKYSIKHQSDIMKSKD